LVTLSRCAGKKGGGGGDVAKHPHPFGVGDFNRLLQIRFLFDTDANNSRVTHHGNYRIGIAADQITGPVT
jgi:hypothetical protein